MADLVTETRADERPCPVCGELAEPEVDGDHRYWECESEDCEAPGYQWGYELLRDVVSEGSCQLGVPESVRRNSSAPMEQAMRKPGVVDLGLTIGRRPE